MKCTNCGSDLSEEALFCPSCGIKVVKEKTESRKVENVEKEKKKGKENNYSYIGSGCAAGMCSWN